MNGRKTFISTGRTIWGIVLVLAIIIIASGLQTPVCAKNAVQRDIMEFVDAQGTLAGFFPYDYVGWASAADDPPVRVALVDYAGVTNDALGLGLGTEFRGLVTERPLPDGGAEVMVILQTRNALFWVTDVGEALEDDEWNCTFCPLVFGARGEDVLDGARPALGNSLLRLKYVNKVFGAPLADLFWDIALGNNEDIDLISVSFHARGFGSLADGSPGITTVDQSSAGGWAVERIEVKPLGRGALRRTRTR